MWIWYKDIGEIGKKVCKLYPFLCKHCDDIAHFDFQCSSPNSYSSSTLSMYCDDNITLNQHDELAFHLPRTLYFSLLSFNECSLFLLLCLAFVFRLDFCSDLVLSFHQGVFWPLVHVGFPQKSFLKKVLMVLEKRKSFMQKSGTSRSLCRLRPRLLHVMLDVFLIVCLVVLL
jgi:hypothetical protein